MGKQSEEKITNLIETAMKNLTTMVDVNTIVGNGIKTENGETVFPISKVTVAFMTGGGEYGKIKVFSSANDKQFAGGSGAILSLKPSGFLLSDKHGNFKLVSVDKEPIEKVYDIVKEYAEKIGKANEKD